MTTKIEWCMNPDGTPGEVWNPVTGCQKLSPGCKNCYAERIANRFWGDRKFTDVVCHEDRLEIPLSWKKPRRVFVNSMSDLFHKDVPFEFVDRVFAVMGRSQHHTFMILTKRPDRMLEYFKSEKLYERVLNQAYKLDSKLLVQDEGLGIGISNLSESAWALPNVWLGVSVENQKAADERIPYLLKTPAAVRFVSCEPLLGPVDLDTVVRANLKNVRLAGGSEGIDWVIAGGESGPGARPMHPDWARSLRDQCQAAGVPFFFKQWGEWVVPFDGERSCRVCGCTDHWACEPDMFDETCGWVEPDLCSRCIGKPIPEGDRPVKFARVGKKTSGRLLDGRAWNEIPAR
jgi:protein gp37